MSMLTADIKLRTRAGNSYGYPVAPGVHVFAGALVALNAAQQLVRVGDAGAVSFAGVADRGLDNSLSAAASSDKVVGQLGLIIAAIVPAATPANRGAAVYASDDQTLTLTQSGALLQVGTLSGFENGTWLKVSV